MLRKVIDCKGFKNSQENIEDGVYFSKVASLQCNDCTFTINRLHHRFFLENVWKTSCLKGTFLKRFMMQHRFNKVQRCSAQPPILVKPEFTLDLTDETLKIYVSTGKHPLWKLLFSKNTGLQSIPAILLKTNATIIIFWHGFCKLTLFEISEVFLRGITAISFIQDVVTLLKMAFLEHIVYRPKFYL